LQAAVVVVRLEAEAEAVVLEAIERLLVWLYLLGHLLL
jgi:hypothetical protein